MRLRLGNKHHLRKSADRKAQIRKAFVPLTELICAFRSAGFLRWCSFPKRNLTHNLFFYFQWFLVLILFLNGNTSTHACTRKFCTLFFIENTQWWNIQQKREQTRSAGDEAWRRGENAWACRAALGLKKFARADHHDILEKRFFLGYHGDLRVQIFLDQARRGRPTHFLHGHASSPADRGTDYAMDTN